METIPITVERARGQERVVKTFKYRFTQERVWEVQEPDSDEWEEFATNDATEETVRQLLRKEYSADY